MEIKFDWHSASTATALKMFLRDVNRGPISKFVFQKTKLRIITRSEIQSVVTFMKILLNKRSLLRNILVMLISAVVVVIAFRDWAQIQVWAEGLPSNIAQSFSLGVFKL